MLFVRGRIARRRSIGSGTKGTIGRRPLLAQFGQAAPCLVLFGLFFEILTWLAFERAADIAQQQIELAVSVPIDYARLGAHAPLAWSWLALVLASSRNAR